MSSHDLIKKTTFEKGLNKNYYQQAMGTVEL